MFAELSARLAELHPQRIVADAFATLAGPLPAVDPPEVPAFLQAMEPWLNQRSDEIFDPFRRCSIPLRQHVWRRNASYTDSQFLEHYAYTEILGPRGRVVKEDYALGLLALAPRTLYPAHLHPADESYIVLAGRADWQVAEGPWCEEPPGAIRHHPSTVPHAMRTGAEPLLAAWLWSGNIAEPARLVAPSPGGVAD